MVSLLYDIHAIQDLKKLPKPVSRMIVEKLGFFASQKNPLSYAKRLTNMDIGSYRFRIGDYRAIIDVHKTKIIVLRIGNRKNIYR